MSKYRRMKVTLLDSITTFVWVNTEKISYVQSILTNTIESVDLFFIDNTRINCRTNPIISADSSQDSYGLGTISQILTGLGGGPLTLSGLAAPYKKSGDDRSYRKVLTRVWDESEAVKGVSVGTYRALEWINLDNVKYVFPTINTNEFMYVVFIGGARLLVERNQLSQTSSTKEEWRISHDNFEIKKYDGKTFPGGVETTVDGYVGSYYE